MEAFGNILSLERCGRLRGQRGRWCEEERKQDLYHDSGVVR